MYAYLHQIYSKAFKQNVVLFVPNHKHVFINNIVLFKSPKSEEEARKRREKEKMDRIKDLEKQRKEEVHFILLESDDLKTKLKTCLHLVCDRNARNVQAELQWTRLLSYASLISLILNWLLRMTSLPLPLIVPTRLHFRKMILKYTSYTIKITMNSITLNTYICMLMFER